MREVRRLTGYLVTLHETFVDTLVDLVPKVADDAQGNPCVFLTPDELRTMPCTMSRILPPRLELRLFTVPLDRLALVHMESLHADGSDPSCDPSGPVADCPCCSSSCAHRVWEKESAWAHNFSSDVAVDVCQRLIEAVENAQVPVEPSPETGTVASRPPPPGTVDATAMIIPRCRRRTSC